MSTLALSDLNLPEGTQRMERVNHWFGPFTSDEADRVIDELADMEKIAAVLKQAMVYGWNSHELGYEIASLLEITHENLKERYGQFKRRLD